jgi:hypothetical protein
VYTLTLGAGQQRNMDDMNTASTTFRSMLHDPADADENKHTCFQKYWDNRVKDTCWLGDGQGFQGEVQLGGVITTLTYLGELCPTVLRADVNSPHVTLCIAKCKQVCPYIGEPQCSDGTPAVVYDTSHACKQRVSKGSMIGECACACMWSKHAPWHWKGR